MAIEDSQKAFVFHVSSDLHSSSLQFRHPRGPCSVGFSIFIESCQRRPGEVGRLCIPVTPILGRMPEHLMHNTVTPRADPKVINPN